MPQLLDGKRHGQVLHGESTSCSPLPTLPGNQDEERAPSSCSPPSLLPQTGDQEVQRVRPQETCQGQAGMRTTATYCWLPSLFLCDHHIPPPTTTHSPMEQPWLLQKYQLRSIAGQLQGLACTSRASLRRSMRRMRERRFPSLGPQASK